MPNPRCTKLVAETGLTANICVLEGNSVILVDRVESPAFIRTEVSIGTAFPVNGSAIGKLLLAHLPRPRVLEMIETYGLPQSARKTITSKTRWLAELDKVRAQGYAINDEEMADGLRSVGAPIVDPDGMVRAGVSVIGETHYPLWEDMDRVIDLIRAAGRANFAGGPVRVPRLTALHDHVGSLTPVPRLRLSWPRAVCVRKTTPAMSFKEIL